MDETSQVDVEKILSSPPEESEVSFNQRDLLLYALGIGETDLQFTYELDDNFAAFPLYPVCLNFKETSSDVVPFPPPASIPTADGLPIINPAMILHGEQSIDWHRPLNPEGETLISKRRIVSMLDKGKGTLMETETKLYEPGSGKEVATLVSGAFIRGLTGYEGKTLRVHLPRIQVPKNAVPERIFKYKTSLDQAKIYRLSGDYNPLHIDSEMASSVGFKKPIIHGLCSMGVATRALYHNYCNGDVAAMKSMRVRFSSPAYPGETMITFMWKKGHEVTFMTKAEERDVIILVGEAMFETRKPISML